MHCADERYRDTLGTLKTVESFLGIPHFDYSSSGNAALSYVVSVMMILGSYKHELQ